MPHVELGARKGTGTTRRVMPVAAADDIQYSAGIGGVADGRDQRYHQ